MPLAVAKFTEHRARASRVRTARAAHAPHPDHRLQSVFIHGIARRRELEQAGSRHRAAVNPGDVVRWRVIVMRKAAADHQHLIRRLDDHCVHRAVRAVTEIDCRIHRAARQQTCDPVPGHAIGLRELACRHDPVVRLDRQRAHRRVRPGADVGRKAAIHRAVAVQARNVIHGHAVKVGEVATHHHASIALDCQRADCIARPAQHVDVEARIRRTIHVQPGDAAHRNVVHVGERPADEHLAREHRVRRVRRHGIHRGDRAGARRKSRVHRAVVVQPRHKRNG